MLASATIVFAGSGLAQVKPKPVKPAPKPITSEVVNWKPAKVSALSIGQKTDAALAKLKNTRVETMVAFALPDRGGEGKLQVKSDYGDRTKMSLSFPRATFKHREEFNKVTLKADGKKAMLFIPQKPTKIGPAGSIRLCEKATVDAWVLNHPQYVFGAMFGENPFTALIKQATASKGYSTKVEERSYRRMDRTYHQFRVLIDRSPAAAKKTGPMHLEFVVDAKFWLPVRVLSDATPKGKERVELMNKLSWGARRTDFPEGTFRFKK